MPQIRLYGSFRAVANIRELTVSAASVRAALEMLWGENAKLRALMLDGDGSLRPYVRILVNGRHMEWAQSLDTPLAPGDEMSIFSPVAGG